MLPLSHDEVVHGKGSLIHKMAGDEWQKFANLRAYYAFMWGYPGKKLLFMGQEFAQRQEWNEATSLEWHLPSHPSHGGMQRLIRDLNHLYKAEPAFTAAITKAEGSSGWSADDAANSVFALCRRAVDGDPPIAVISNFTPVPREGYRVPLPTAGHWREIMNTDADHLWRLRPGQSWRGRCQCRTAHGEARSAAAVQLPPLATHLLRAWSRVIAGQPSGTTHSQPLQHSREKSC